MSILLFLFRGRVKVFLIYDSFLLLLFELLLFSLDKFFKEKLVELDVGLISITILVCSQKEITILIKL